MTGIIIKGIGGFYYVKAADNNVYECRARGLFRRDGITPMIGDRVDISDNTIVKIHERTTMLTRPPVANVDTLLLVAAAAEPEPNTLLLDKMSINARQCGIETMLCINKSELADRHDLAEIYESALSCVIFTSAKEGRGIDELRELLKGRVTAFAGLSGVGKSTLLSLITNRSLETGSVSEKIMRGRHTTRHVELFALDEGGFVLDTPGFSSLETENIDADKLWEYFPEMAQAQGRCRFRGCSHINEPDCYVKKLLEEGKIKPSRYESYKEIYGRLKLVKKWEKK
ncbi:MAG: ribosome small subunit-dependent GTPase A [Clostridiales bacterium]|nr:ribosome small subunit-dependent GTPase A [Clostridiales bacterium]